MATLADGRIVAARQGQIVGHLVPSGTDAGYPLSPVFSFHREMTIRSLDILDLPLLSRYRRDILPLDSAHILTRGNPLGAMAMLSYLNPRRTVYTAVASRIRRFADGPGDLERR